MILFGFNGVVVVVVVVVVCLFRSCKVILFYCYSRAAVEVFSCICMVLFIRVFGPRLVNSGDELLIQISAICTEMPFPLVQLLAN